MGHTQTHHATLGRSEHLACKEEAKTDTMEFGRIKTSLDLWTHWLHLWIPCFSWILWHSLLKKYFRKIVCARKVFWYVNRESTGASTVAWWVKSATFSASIVYGCWFEFWLSYFLSNSAKTQSDKRSYGNCLILESVFMVYIIDLSS